MRQHVPTSLSLPPASLPTLHTTQKNHNWGPKQLGALWHPVSLLSFRADIRNNDKSWNYISCYNKKKEPSVEVLFDSDLIIIRLWILSCPVMVAAYSPIRLAPKQRSKRKSFLFESQWIIILTARGGVNDYAEWVKNEDVWGISDHWWLC